VGFSRLFVALSIEQETQLYFGNTTNHMNIVTKEMFLFNDYYILNM